MQIVPETPVLKKAKPVFRAVIQATYKENFAFRSNMAVSLIVQPIYFLVQYSIWRAVFQAHDTVSGFTFKTMLFYFAVSSLLGFLNWDDADGTLQRLVEKGKFITFQLRPVTICIMPFSWASDPCVLVEMVPILGFYLFSGSSRFRRGRLASFSVALSFILAFL